MTEQQFLGLTLGKFWLLYECWMDREDRLNLRSSIIASFVANTAPRGKKSTRKALEPHDIIPPLRKRQAETELTDEQQAAVIEQMFGAPVPYEDLPDYLK